LLFLDIFSKYARVNDVQIVMDKKTQKSRGFGFIYFDDVHSATRVYDQN
jgi:RNA recognition motif-containing protein